MHSRTTIRSHLSSTVLQVTRYALWTAHSYSCREHPVESTLHGGLGGKWIHYELFPTAGPVNLHGKKLVQSMRHSTCYTSTLLEITYRAVRQ